MRQIFLDTETTGLRVEEGHRIVELAMVEYDHRQSTGREYHTYINPERDIDPGSFKVHGLSREFLSDHLVFSELVDGFFGFVRDAQVVIHNAPFDLGFINAEIERCNQSRTTSLPMLEQVCQIEDSLLVARSKYGGRNDLNSLCTRLGIDNTERILHGALVDAHLLAKVYLAMTSTQGCLELKVDNDSDQLVDDLPDDLSFLKLVKANNNELAEHNKYMEKLGY